MIFYLDRHEKTQAIFTNNGSESCPYYDDNMKEDLNTGGSSYEFKVPSNHPSVNLIEEGGYIVRRDLDGAMVMFTIMQIEDVHTTTSDKYIYAENAGLELLNDIYRPITHMSKNASEILDLVLADTRWKRGETTYFGIINYYFKEYQNVLSALQYVRGKTDGELRFRVEMTGGKITGRYVDLLERRGNDTKKRFTFNKDIMSISRKVDMSNLVTALIGVGKGDSDGNNLTFKSVGYYTSDGKPFQKPINQDWVGDSEALQRYGIQGKHIFGTFQFDTDDPAELLEETYKELQKRKNPEITYELSVSLLERLANYEHEKVRLGDNVFVIDETFSPPLYLRARVRQLETSFSDPSKDVCTLGTFRVHQSNITAEMRAIQAKLLKKEVVWDTGTKPLYTWVRYADDANGTGMSEFPEDKSYMGLATNQVEETPSKNAALYMWSLIRGKDGESPEPGESDPITDIDIENKIPPKPTKVVATGLFKNIMIEWDYVNSLYISHYEVFASTTSNFSSGSTESVFKGLTGFYTHKANTNQLWYFRVRAVNRQGIAGPFSDTVSAMTAKVISDEILFGAVTAEKIRDLAVEADKLSGSSVTAEKIANLAVGDAAIKNLSVTNQKIGYLSVGQGQIQDLAITNAKIGNLAVDDAKIASISAAKINAGTITGVNIATVDSSLSGKVTLLGSTLKSSKYGTSGTREEYVKIENGLLEIKTSNSYGMYQTVKIDGNYGVNMTTDVNPYANLRLDVLETESSSSSAKFLLRATSDVSSHNVYLRVEADDELELRSNNVNWNGNTLATQPWVSSWYSKIVHNHDYTSPTFNRITATGDGSRWVVTDAVDTGASHLYVRATSGNEVKATVVGSTGSYVAVRAASFPTGSSIKFKTNIEELTYDEAKYLLDNSNVFKYHLINNVESGIYDKPKIGMIAEMIPQQFRDEDGVDTYSIITALFRVVKEQDKMIEMLRVRINDIENMGGI